VFGPRAHGDQQVVALEDLAVGEGDLDAVLGLLGLLGEDAEGEGDAALLVGPLEGLGDRLVLVGDQVGQALHDRHGLRAERLPHRGELDADHAAAEDDRVLRQLGQLQRRLGVEEATAQVDAGEGLGVGARGEDDVGAGQRAGAGVGLDGDRVLAGQRAEALDVLDLAGLHQALEALVQAPDDLVLEAEHLGDVDPVEGEVHTGGGGFGGRVGELSDVEQGLRRDAAAVQAGAAELVLLHEGDLLAELGSAQRGRIAAAATSQDHDVELVSGCVRHLCAPRCLGVFATGSDLDGRPRRLRVPC
jgi:hypothetical protein